MDLLAIGQGIAAQFTGVTVNGKGFTSPPTAMLPNTVAKGPVCLVYPPTGAFDTPAVRQRADTYDFPVKILIDPLDVPTRSALLYAWFNATRDRVGMNYTLDLPYVAVARCIGVRIEIDGEQYSNSPFDVIEYTVRVLVREVITTLAP